MTQRAIAMVLGLALISAVTLFLPLIIRLFRLLVFERQLREWLSDSASTSNGESSVGTAGGGHRFNHEEMRRVFAESPIAAAYEEFERRWQTAALADGIDRAPIRLLDIFDERPLLPFGPRRSLLPVMPGLFLGVGVFAALVGLIPGLGGQVVDPLVVGDVQSNLVATQIGLALRASAWGFICAIGATLSGRLIEGAYDARSHSLDEAVEDAFGSVSPGELAEITRQTQQRSIETLGKELSHFASELNERLDRGLQRIEQSTARSANLVSQEQRGALHTVVQELSLSVRQGVEHHLGELRGALQRAVEHQSSVTGGLAETFERMVENSQIQDRVARTLADSASSVEAAAEAMRGSATDMKPILEHLSSTSRGLADTARQSPSEPPTSTRDRSWSPAPTTHRPESPSTPTMPTMPSSEDRGLKAPSGSPPATPSKFGGPAETTRKTNLSDRSKGLESSEAEDANTDESGDATESTGRDSASSGYRLGTPRAKGPDPYSRLDNDPEQPSNMRHFPTPDRDLGDNLKLSDLLGRNPEDDSTTPNAKSDKTSAEAPGKPSDKTPGKTSSAPDARDKSSRSSDDSE